MPLDKEQIILGPLSALALRPGDVLVIHNTAGLTPNQRRSLDQQVMKALWGKPNTHMIIEGPFRVAVVHHGSTNVEQGLLDLWGAASKEQQTDFLAKVTK